MLKKIRWEKTGGIATVTALFFLLLLFAGGSARGDAPALALLRPLSILLFGYIVAKVTLADIRRAPQLFALVGAIVALVLIHILPLPSGVSLSLPGRDVIRQIVSNYGTPSDWMPITMDPDGGWNAFYSIFAPLAVLLIVFKASAERRFTYLNIMLGCIAVTTIVGITQAAGADLRLYRFNSEMSGVFANRNHQSAFLATAIPAVYLALFSMKAVSVSNTARFILFACAVALIFTLIIVTGSRMGLFLAFLGVVLIPFVDRSAMSFLLSRQNMKAKLLIVGSLVSIVLASFILLTLNARNVTAERLGDIDDSSRSDVWATIWEAVPRYMPLGSGNGSYVRVYQMHEESGLLSQYYSNHAHNDWLEVVLTLGLPGIVILSLCVLMFMLAAYRNRSIPGTEGNLRRLGFTIIFLLGIASVVDYPLRTPLLASVFAMAVAWATAPERKYKTSNGRHSHGI